MGLGFIRAASVRLGNIDSNVSAVVALWVNRSAGDMATVLSMASLVKNVLLPGFDTRFDDGSRVETSNRRGSECFVHAPEDSQLAVPKIRDAEQLYRIHRRRVEKRRKPMSCAVVPAPGEELQVLQGEWVESLEEQVKARRYYFDARHQCYRPTLRGAFLMTWGLIWPISGIWKWMRHRAALAELRELDLDPARG